MRISITLSLLFFFAVCSSQQISDFSVECKQGNHRVKKQTNIDKSHPMSLKYDMVYQRLNLIVDPRVHYIVGDVKCIFSVEQAMDQFYIDLDDALFVDSIVYHNSLIATSFEQGKYLIGNLPGTLLPGTVDSLIIYYKGQPASTGNNGMLQGSHATDSVLWTLSEPYSAYEWWPCKQDLSDKIDSIDVLVRTPKKYRSAGSGILVRDEVLGNYRYQEWQHRYPVAAYLIAVTVSNYAVFSYPLATSLGNVDFVNYVYPQDSATLHMESLKMQDIMTLFDTSFGVYPFYPEKYGHVQFERPGGMEHQTMSSMYHFGFSLMAHELAHQWFGNKVTCGSWKDIWLNEGLASYATAEAYRYLEPFWWRPWREDALYGPKGITSQPDGSVYCPDTTDVDRIFDGRLSYKKGAYVLRMLEWKLGRKAFYQALHNYLVDPNLAFKFAVTDHLKAHMEQTSSMDLTEFFADWIYGQGYPIYTVNWRQDNFKLKLTLGQTTSHNSVDFYEMPVPIYAKNSTGDDTLLVFEHSFDGQQYEVLLDFKVDSLFFDPEMWLISGQNQVTTGMAKFNDEDSSILIYPNPSKGNFIIEIKEVNHWQASIYDAKGQEVVSLWREPIKEIAVPLSKGVYFLSYIKNSFKGVKRIVID